MLSFLKFLSNLIQFFFFHLLFYYSIFFLSIFFPISCFSAHVCFPAPAFSSCSNQRILVLTCLPPCKPCSTYLPLICYPKPPCHLSRLSAGSKAVYNPACNFSSPDLQHTSSVHDRCLRAACLLRLPFLQSLYITFPLYIHV